MSEQLSKLHVRFIQTQKKLYLQRDKTAKGESLPIAQLYVKDNHNFYMINQNDTIQDGSTLTLIFKEATPALNTLTATVRVQALEKECEDYEDALMFFNTDPNEVKQILLLNILELR